MKYLVTIASLALSALALFPANAQQAKSPAQTEPAPKCSRNADDITAAIVIQNANGEFCEGSAEVSLDAGANAANAKTATKMSSAQFQALRNKAVKDHLFFCTDQGAPRDFCKMAVDLSIDRAFVLYYRKCERKRIEIARCDAELIEALAFEWY